MVKMVDYILLHKNQAQGDFQGLSSSGTVLLGPGKVLSSSGTVRLSPEKVLSGSGTVLLGPGTVLLSPGKAYLQGVYYE